MSKKLYLIFCVLITLTGCTLHVNVSPVKFAPSFLKKNPAQLAYFIDTKLVTLVETETTGVIKKEISLGNSIAESIRNMMNEIFYTPTELQSDSSTKGIVVKFFLVDSKLVRVPATKYSYEIKVNLRIFKDANLIDEVNITGSHEIADYWAKKTGDSIEQQLEATCTGAIAELVDRAGEFLMNYKF